MGKLHNHIKQLSVDQLEIVSASGERSSSSQCQTIWNAEKGDLSNFQKFTRFQLYSGGDLRRMPPRLPTESVAIKVIKHWTTIWGNIWILYIESKSIELELEPWAASEKAECGALSDFLEGQPSFSQRVRFRTDGLVSIIQTCHTIKRRGVVVVAAKPCARVFKGHVDIETP